MHEGLRSSATTYPLCDRPRSDALRPPFTRLLSRTYNPSSCTPLSYKPTTPPANTYPKLPSLPLTTLKHAATAGSNPRAYPAHDAREASSRSLGGRRRARARQWAARLVGRGMSSPLFWWRRRAWETRREEREEGRAGLTGYDGCPE